MTRGRTMEEGAGLTCENPLLHPPLQRLLGVTQACRRNQSISHCTLWLVHRAENILHTAITFSPMWSTADVSAPAKKELSHLSTSRQPSAVCQMQTAVREESGKELWCFSYPPLLMASMQFCIITSENITWVCGHFFLYKYLSCSSWEFQLKGKIVNRRIAAIGNSFKSQGSQGWQLRSC